MKPYRDLEIQRRRVSDGNENFKTAIGLISKTTTLHVEHTLFVYISLSCRHLHDLRRESFVEDGNKQQQNFLSLTLSWLKKSSPTFDKKS